MSFKSITSSIVESFVSVIVMLMAMSGCHSGATVKSVSTPLRDAQAMGGSRLALLTAKQRWDAATSERERRDICIEMIDSKLISHYRLLDNAVTVFGSDFQVWNTEHNGSGHGFVYMTPPSERDYVNWGVGKWHLYLHYVNVRTESGWQTLIDDYYISNHSEKDIGMVP
jgi:hypothetical protein